MYMYMYSTASAMTEKEAGAVLQREGRRSIREWLKAFSRKGWAVREIVAIARLAIPMVATNFFYQIMFTVALIFVGQISERSLQLDAAALALSLMNVTGVSVGIGLVTAAETLCSQMYGFKNYKGVGVVTQRGIWILGLAMFPVLVVWLNTESLLLLIQQDPCVARLTALYVQIFSGALPALFLFFVLQRYLVAQSIVLPFILVGILNNIISVLLHGMLIYWAEMGLRGSSIALALSTVSSPLILLLYIRLRNLHRHTWGGWSFESLRGWSQYVRLGVPGLLMICFEWWCYELGIFVTGSINKTQLAIYTIILQILSLNFMLPYGVSIALTVRVGNELGAGNPTRAKRATYVAFGITVCQTLLVALFLAATRSVLGKIFSQDQEVIAGVGEVVYVIIPLVFSDSLQGMMQGVLKGTGKQLSGAVINFVIYYIIGFPLGTLLATVAGMGALGMWSGLLVSSILQMVTFLGLVLTLNWRKEAERAQKRAQDSPTDSSVLAGSSGSADQESVSVVSLVEEKEDEREAEEEGEGEGEEAQLVFKGSTVNSCRTLGLTDIQANWETLGDITPEEAEGEEKRVRERKSKEKRKDGDGKAIEEVPLVPLDQPDDAVEQNPELVLSSATNNPTEISGAGRSKSSSSRLRLLVSRLSFLVIAVILLVLGGVASRYHPHRPLSDYCECETYGNGTEDWVCGNETAPESEFGTTSVLPTPTLTAVVHTETSYLLPTPSPLYN